MMTCCQIAVGREKGRFMYDDGDRQEEEHARWLAWQAHLAPSPALRRRPPLFSAEERYDEDDGGAGV